MRSLSKLLVFMTVFWAGAAALCVPAHAQSLPSEIEARLNLAGIPKDAIALYVVDAAVPASEVAKMPPVLAHREHQLMHPASTLKLVTTIAALELLGADYRWKTQVLIRPRDDEFLGRRSKKNKAREVIENGVLRGDLVIKGGGDPKLVTERLMLLLQRVRGLGIHTIDGDIVLDHTLFEPLDKTAADFDGEPLRPYNVLPDAFLVQFQSVVMTFTPQPDLGVAWVDYGLPLTELGFARQVPLAAGACGDYRAALKLNMSDVSRWRFEGTYPASCGERTWAVAYQPSQAFAALAVSSVWRSLGAKLTGTVRSVRAPRAPGSDQAQNQRALPVFDFSSVALAEVVRDVNRFSNNVMAQQLFLSLSWADGAPQNALPLAGLTGDAAASFSAARRVLNQWWQARFGGMADRVPPVMENGSGLSRTERLSAFALARLLQSAYAAPYAPDLLASLPQQEGLMSPDKAPSVAYFKTGSLVNVMARAGYVVAPDGKRYVLVMLVNSDQPTVLANSRDFIRYLVDWVASQGRGAPAAAAPLPAGNELRINATTP